MDRTFVAIDVETTGLEAGVDEIIEVAAVKFRGDEVLETFSQLVKPRHSLPLKITRLTGISAESLAGAPRFSEVAPDLVRFVKSYPLVGHSIGFDIRMLQAQGMRFAQHLELHTLEQEHEWLGMLDDLGKTFDQVWKERAAGSPAKRYGRPEEFGAYFAFLCSAHAGYISGQNLLIDGGSYPGTF